MSSGHNSAKDGFGFDMDDHLAAEQQQQPQQQPQQPAAAPVLVAATVGAGSTGTPRANDQDQEQGNDAHVSEADVAKLLASSETPVDVEIEQPDGKYEKQTAVKLLRVPVGFFKGKTVDCGLEFDGHVVCSESQIVPSVQSTEDGAPIIRIARPTDENAISFEVGACDARRSTGWPWPPWPTAP